MLIVVYPIKIDNPLKLANLVKEQLDKEKIYSSIILSLVIKKYTFVHTLWIVIKIGVCDFTDDKKILI